MKFSVPIFSDQSVCSAPEPNEKPISTFETRIGDGRLVGMVKWSGWSSDHLHLFKFLLQVGQEIEGTL